MDGNKHLSSVNSGKSYIFIYIKHTHSKKAIFRDSLPERNITRKTET